MKARLLLHGAPDMKRIIWLPFSGLLALIAPASRPAVAGSPAALLAPSAAHAATQRRGKRALGPLLPRMKLQVTGPQKQESITRKGTRRILPRPRQLTPLELETAPGGHRHRLYGIHIREYRVQSRKLTQHVFEIPELAASAHIEVELLPPVSERHKEELWYRASLLRRVLKLRGPVRNGRTHSETIAERLMRIALASGLAEAEEMKELLG